MPKPQAKAGKSARAQAAIEHGVSADQIFLELCQMYQQSEGEDRWTKGMELMPYLKPKLKAVDVTQTADVRVTITIGGLDDVG